MIKIINFLVELIKMGSILSSLAFRPPVATYKSDINGLVMINNTIPMRYIEYPGVNTVLLFSHGNNMDIGKSYISELSYRWKVNVCAYDYSGYGLHKVRVASEKSMYEDIQSVFEYLVDVMKFETSDIILYGQSLGTVPTCYLASKTNVRGVVLHSPLSSMLSVVGVRCDYFDAFMNRVYIKDIKQPSMILHGDEDDVISVDNSRELWRLLPDDAKYKLVIVNKGKHNDLHKYDVFQDEMIEFIKR